MSSSSGPSTTPAPAEVPEALLNRRLRRVDWRFLLPLPRVRRAVCYVGGDLHEGVALMAERLVPPEVAIAADCDLAVVVDPDEAALRAAWAALRPGGVCYTEWTTTALAGPRRLRSRLQSAGFEGVRSYLPWRSLARAIAWIPLDSAAATRYFQRRLHARSPRRQLPARLLRSLVTLGAKAGLARPLCTLARKPGEAESRDGAPVFFGTIRHGWRSWGLAGEPKGLSIMLLTGGPRSGSKVAGLVFAESSTDPALIVKLARSSQADAGLLQEARTLSALDPRNRSGRVLAPAVVFSIDSKALVAVGETAHPGAPLLTLLNRQNYRRFALQATDWLIDLANTTRRDEPLSARRIVQDIVAGFELNFGGVIEPASLAEARRIVSSLDDLPLVCEHRDFSPWNLFVTTDDRLAVFDWESSEPDGLPLLDPIYFLTYLAAALEREGHDGVIAAWHAAHDPKSLAGAVRRECLLRYASGVRLDAASVPALALLVWMIHSRSEYRRLVGDAGDRPTEEALRRSLFLRLWQAELDHQRTS